MDWQEHIDVVCDRIDRVDPLVQALLPEPARRSRLHREADALLGWANRLCGLVASPSG